MSKLGSTGNPASLVGRILIFSLAASPCFADLLQGTFSADNQVALFNITANTSEILTVQSYSYAGGTFNSTVIPAGGFAPTAFLFDNIGGLQTLTNGSCGQVGQDPVTGNCDDLYFQDLLAPGTYTLALAVYNNTPMDNFAADGFVQDSNPGFTCQETGTGGSFCDITDVFGSTRTGNYDVAVTETPVPPPGVPEPGSMLLLLTGAALACLMRRRGFHSRSI